MVVFFFTEFRMPIENAAKIAARASKVLVYCSDKGVDMTSQTDQDLNRAIRNIYVRYGRDLSAFFKVVQNELRHERRRPARRIPQFSTAAKLQLKARSELQG